MYIEKQGENREDNWEEQKAQRKKEELKNNLSSNFFLEKESVEKTEVFFLQRHKVVVQAAEEGFEGKLDKNRYIVKIEH